MEPVSFKKEKLVLDTSLFVNPEVRRDFGRNPTEAIEGFLFLAAQIPTFEFYMPSSTFRELLNFVDINKVPGDLLTMLHQKPPSRHELTFPAVLLYELIDDMRDRVNKGLRIAEKAVRNVAKADEKEIIQGLRRNYRDALREVIIDSGEDVDLILLAKELDALLVTVDNGIINWAEKFGIRWILPTKFKDYLLSSIKRCKEQTIESQG
ncbi:MAG TPA: RNA ligase partner protein [Nitrospirae bacterium]|nr:RNA ligase partner protein [Nitrospirota bacterium]